MKHLIIILFSLTICTGLHAFNEANALPGLEEFDSQDVFSAVQDSTGAMWINSARGIFRFNGIKAEFMKADTPKQSIAYDGGRELFCVTGSRITAFDVSDLSVKEYSEKGVSFQYSVLLATGDSLLVGNRNCLYAICGGSLKLLRKLEESVSITALILSPEGKLVVGTASSGVLLLGKDGSAPERILDCNDRVSRLFTSREGNIFIGFEAGRILVMKPGFTGMEDRIAEFSRCNSKRLSSIRSFDQQEDAAGNVYVGTAAGLFLIDKDFGISEVDVAGKRGRAISTAYFDKGGNLWICTVYHGIIMENPGLNPFEPISYIPSGLYGLNGLAIDSNGFIWASTDGYGLYRIDTKTGRSSLIPGTDGVKLQGLYYDRKDNALWAGVFTDKIIRYDERSGMAREYRVQGSNGVGYIRTFCRLGDDLVLGGNLGLYLFNPDRETTVSRRIEWTVSPVFSVRKDPFSEKIWIASSGLYTYTPTEGVLPFTLSDPQGHIWLNNHAIMSLEAGSDGTLWLGYSRMGVAMVRSGRTKVFTDKENGLIDNYCTSIAPIDSLRAIVATTRGISIIDTGTGRIFNFPSEKGRKICPVPGGGFLIGGNDGFSRIQPSGFPGQNGGAHIRLDHMYVNGQLRLSASALCSGKTVRLNHNEKNFSFDIASFNYANTEAVSYYCKLENFEDEWSKFDPDSKVAYMNIPHGEYVFRAMATSGIDSQLRAEVFLPLKIRQVWYSSWWFLCALILLFSGISGTILYFVISKRRIEDQLRKKELEAKERTRLFMDISNRLRTPLNLIIGNIELFFKKFGSRTAGIESIEDIYNKSKSMREMVYGFSDEQARILEDEVGDSEQIKESARKTRFVNAATGAVERNLFNGKVTISTLCSELNLGKTALCERMKDATGATPHEFIEDVRLGQAAKMLREGSYQVAELSDMLGYSNPKYFTLRFKKKFGVTPSVWKAGQ